MLVCSAQTPQQNAQRTIETTLLDDLPTPEVAVPTAPVAFLGDGKRFLCYELLITNTEPIPARLQRVAVYADGAAVPLLLQEAKPLSTALLHPGVSDEIMAKRDRRVIRGGEQVVDLLWIELPVGSPIPRFLGSHAYSAAHHDWQVAHASGRTRFCRWRGHDDPSASPWLEVGGCKRSIEHFAAPDGHERTLRYPVLFPALCH